MLQYVFFSVFLAVIAAVCSILHGGWDNRALRESWRYHETCKDEEDLKKVNKCRIRFGGYMLVFAFLIFWGILWLTQPTLSLETYDIIWFIVGAEVVGFCGQLLFIEMWNHGKSDIMHLKAAIKTLWALVLPLVFLLYAFVASCAMIGNNASRLQNILEVEVMRNDSTYANDIAPVDIEHMISVDAALARKIAETKLGQMPALGSRVEIGEMSIQNLTGEFTINDGENKPHHLSFNNEQVWVAPLEHRSFWKWNKFRTTPGYILVSAIDRQKVYFVNHLDGKDVQLKYLNSSCFGSNLLRYVRNHGFVNAILADSDFELDNHGRPHMIYTILEPQVGLRGMVPVGVIVLDAQTGEINAYELNNAPEWIDIIVPEELVEKTINWWGEYHQGYWNSVFAQDSVQIATHGTTNLYNEGKTYWYTGIQSAGKDQSTSGFMMIDSRTMKAKLYPKAGITETRAMSIAQGQPGIKEAKYTATFPVPYNIRGMFSYFMALKDSTSGEIMSYAFVSVEKQDIVGVGKSKTEAERNYVDCAMRVSKDMLKAGAVEDKSDVFIIRDIMHEGNRYYVCFEEIRGIEFTATSEFLNELRHAKNGHKVEVTYEESDGTLYRLTKFKNLSFEL